MASDDDNATHGVEQCPICGDGYVKKRELVRKGKTRTESVSIRDDFAACREKRTELRGGHGNWSKTDVLDVYIHDPNGNADTGTSQEHIDDGGSGR